MSRRGLIALGVVQLLAWGLLGVFVIADAKENNLLLAGFALGALIFCVFFGGFFWGREMLRYESAPKMTTCVGGPIDGSLVPRPPKHAGHPTVTLDDHEEGFYTYDGDNFVWQEHD
jgi:hypothetical protein